MGIVCLNSEYCNIVVYCLCHIGIPVKIKSIHTHWNLPFTVKLNKCP